MSIVIFLRLRKMQQTKNLAAYPLEQFSSSHSVYKEKHLSIVSISQSLNRPAQVTQPENVTLIIQVNENPAILPRQSYIGSVMFF